MAAASQAADPAGSGARTDPDTPDSIRGSGGEPDEDGQETGTAAHAPTEADPEAPRPLGVGTEPTGHSPVDAQLRRLADADHLAVSGHLEVYEDVHRGLRDTLAALDTHDAGS
ncbi:hypothetical protein AN216_13295 [Streptomyces oceani]|uniref:Uncharacterized protein n=1 Tax=Streptomyces oceani TaxID=1075402 RepID=A0A1E7KGX7_9ACTN|nr:hypothetical protein AN216_13295 [Streptomyces oceani]